MKVFSRIAVVVVAASILFLATGISWLLFYSGDLPELAGISDFAPKEASVGTDDCVAPHGVSVIPYTALGSNISNATRASERAMELQVARSLLCHYRGSNIARILLEYKASLILHRRFTPEQLLAIYLNRAYFGTGVTGVQAASEHYYNTTPDHLSVPQAAMLIGLLNAPGYYSPEAHPDRCKRRRDEVIGAMLLRGAITSQEANSAKQAPLI